MANYDDHPLTLTFTYKQWRLIQDCLQKRREDHHSRADHLELDDTDAQQVAGIRRKAALIFDVMEEIRGGMGDIRVADATARREVA